MVTSESDEVLAKHSRPRASLKLADVFDNLGPLRLVGGASSLAELTSHAAAVSRARELSSVVVVLAMMPVATTVEVRPIVAAVRHVRRGIENSRRPPRAQESRPRAGAAYKLEMLATAHASASDRRERGAEESRGLDFLSEHPW